MSVDNDWYGDRSAPEVIRRVREALHVPEASHIIDFARLHFARSCVATDIYNIMDSMPEGVGEEFMRDRIMTALAKFPDNSGEDRRVWDDRPRKLGDVGHYVPRSFDSPPLPGEDVS